MNHTTAMTGHVDPNIALALLRALRSRDRPDEMLGDEDLQQSLPRRLGLSNVVEKQIDRYSALRGRRRRLEAKELGDLFRLVSRRADAEAVFGEAGRRLAEQELSRRGVGARFALVLSPGSIRRRVLVRALQRMARAISPGGSIQCELHPPTLTLWGSLPATACESAVGCELLSSGFATFARTYLRCECSVHHPLCEGGGEDRCVWVVEGMAG